MAVWGSDKVLSGFQIHGLTPHLSPSLPPSRTGVLDSCYRGNGGSLVTQAESAQTQGSAVAPPALLPRPPSAACPCLCFPRIALSDTRGHNATRATVKCNSCNPRPQMLVAPLEPSQGRDAIPSPTAPLSGFQQPCPLLGGIIAKVSSWANASPQLRARLGKRAGLCVRMTLAMVTL